MPEYASSKLTLRSSGSRLGGVVAQDPAHELGLLLQARDIALEMGDFVPES